MYIKHLLFFLLIPLFSTAELSPENEAKIDSLKKIIESAEHDTIEIQALLQWNDLIYAYYPDLDLEQNNRIAEICRKNLNSAELGIDERLRIKYKKNLSRALHNLGYSYIGLGKYIDAIAVYHECLELREELKDTLLIAGTLNNLSQAHQEIGDNSIAIDYLVQALKLNEAVGDSIQYAMALGNIGNIHYTTNNMDIALDYYHRALEIEEKINNPEGIARITGNIASIYLERADYEEAEKLNLQVIEMEESAGRHESLGSSYSNLGLVYYQTGEYEKGMEYFQKSKKLSKQINDPLGYAYALNNIGLVYDKYGNTPKAIENTKEALDIVEEMQNLASIESFALQLYLLNKKAYRSKAALEAHEKYVTAKDSLNSVTTQRDILNQEYKYAYEKIAFQDSIKYAQEQVIVEVQLEKEELLLAS